MTDTPNSLLVRLRLQPDDDSWKRLIDLYTPLLQRWLRKLDIHGSDADDLLQETFLVLVREISYFQHNHQQGAFRCWLRTVLVNRLRPIGLRGGRGCQPPTRSRP